MFSDPSRRYKEDIRIKIEFIKKKITSMMGAFCISLLVKLSHEAFSDLTFNYH
jgi:hypothetical protein